MRGKRALQRQAVLEQIKGAGPFGISMKEVAVKMGVEFNRISGRGSELKQDGKVQPTGMFWRGSEILVVINAAN